MINILRTTLVALALLFASCGGGGDEGGGAGGGSVEEGTTGVGAFCTGESVTGQFISVMRVYSYDTGELYTGSVHLNPGQGAGYGALPGKGTFNVDVDFGPYGGGPHGATLAPPWVGPNVDEGGVGFWRSY